MTEKTKLVTVRDRQYQLRKMLPDVGSFIYLRMIGAVYNNKVAQDSGEAQPAEPEVKPKPEETARLVCGVAFMRGLSFEDLQFTQRHAMMVVSLMEDMAGTLTPMPVMTDSGKWANPELKDDAALVQELTMEALVFNLAGFFG